MKSVSPVDPEPAHRRTFRLHSFRRRLLWVTAVLACAYVIAAYLILPRLWLDYERRHPALDRIPKITRTADDIPGDPLNVALVGSRDQLVKSMLVAGWHQAAALGLKSDIEIAADTVLSRPDDNAPVSSLYLFGRKQDLAFEQPVGDSPRKRHHVRFWEVEKTGDSDRSLWVGSATFDERVGLSHTTAQITHHTAADVDVERDYLLGELQASGQLIEQYALDDFHSVREGRNGGGDPWHTDGQLRIGILTPETFNPAPSLDVSTQASAQGLLRWVFRLLASLDRPAPPQEAAHIPFSSAPLFVVT